ncbi:MAG: pyridoxal phosphate-dependent aminotransferase [Clostridiales bacterium]|nr:pyridoxal phosphate-dependent aminotransferase [Clostridiales bacterium]
MRYAKRIDRLSSESAFKVLAAAKKLEAQGKDVIHFEIGEPDFDTPKNIKEAAKKAIDDGFTHYTNVQGLPELRKAIVEYTLKYKKLKISEEEIVVTPGGKPILFFALQALINTGDEVIYPDPGYPVYPSLINFSGGIPVPIEIRETEDFKFNIEDLRNKITPKTKLIILNNPANPTGGFLTESDIDQIYDVIKDTEIYVLSDEIYNRMIYDGTTKSIATLPKMKDRTIILDGFSKTYAMTGFRLGYGIMNKELAQKITTLVVNSNSSTCTFIQIAGIEALNGPQIEVDRMVEIFKKRRDLIVNGLNSIEGITCLMPQAAFYVFPNITGTGMSSDALADYLLEDANVAVLSGKSFGDEGEGYIRLSFANSEENIIRAIDRIKESINKIR